MFFTEIGSAAALEREDVVIGAIRVAAVQCQDLAPGLNVVCSVKII